MQVHARCYPWEGNRFWALQHGFSAFQLGLGSDYAWGFRIFPRSLYHIGTVESHEANIVLSCAVPEIFICQPKLSKQWDDQWRFPKENGGTPTLSKTIHTMVWGSPIVSWTPPNLWDAATAPKWFSDDSQVAFWVHEAAMWEWVTSGPAVHRKHQQNGLGISRDLHQQSTFWRIWGIPIQI